MALPQDFRPHKPSPQKHATLPTVRTSPARRPASRVPVPVRRARAAYVEDADETHDVPASGAGAGASFSGDAPAGDLASALVVGDAPADDSTLILEGRGEASADAPAMVAGHKHGRTPSPASPSSSSSSSPSPKRQRRDEQVWSLPLQAARPRTPAARTPSPHTSVSEATPAPILSSPAEPWPLLPHAEAVADLSANLSASSHSRALMLARPRPTACIEVASLDPVAAARAAAILQVHHHYIQEGWLVQEPPAGARRHGAGAAYPALPDVSGSVSLPALLKAAEDGERSWSAAVPGAFPPGSARRRRSLRAPVVTAHALRPQAQAGKWSDDAWAQLERHLAAEVARHVEAGASDDAAPVDADVAGVSIGRVASWAEEDPCCSLDVAGVKGGGAWVSEEGSEASSALSFTLGEWRGKCTCVLVCVDVALRGRKAVAWLGSSGVAMGGSVDASGAFFFFFRIRLPLT